MKKFELWDYDKIITLYGDPAIKTYERVASEYTLGFSQMNRMMATAYAEFVIYFYLPGDTEMCKFFRDFNGHRVKSIVHIMEEKKDEPSPFVLEQERKFQDASGLRVLS